MNTLAGIAGIFGGLFSSPVIAVMLILEVARPGGRRFPKTLVTDIAAASISFGIYFAVAGDDRGLWDHHGGVAAVRMAYGSGHREIDAGRHLLASREERRSPRVLRPGL